MRLTCPICGERDRREFTVKGAALMRPTAEADLDQWHDYVNLRDNPAGLSDEHWQHDMGCGAWLVVTRNSLTHEISAVRLATDGAGEGS